MWQGAVLAHECISSLIIINHPWNVTFLKKTVEAPWACSVNYFLFICYICLCILFFLMAHIRFFMCADMALFVLVS